MDALTQALMQSLASGGLEKIGSTVGADRDTASSALSAVIPALVTGLAKNSAKPEGAESLLRALQEDHDGSVLSNLDGLLGDPAAGEGAGILSHVLGAKQPVVEKGLAGKTGMSAAQVSQLLAIAAPLVMGALGKQQREKGLDAGGLSSLLGSAMKADADADPDLLGMLNTMLDADKDGSAVDEVMGFVGKLFKKG